MERKEIINFCKSDPEAAATLIENLYTMIEKLESRVKILEDRISKDSHNSHKPPSSDSMHKKDKIKNQKTKSLRNKSDRKSGGQKGHKGKTLELVPNPDIKKRLKICNCEKCGKDISGNEVKDLLRRQVFDIKRIESEITEFQSEIIDCDCGHTNTATFPEGVTHKTQYGPYLGSFAVYFSNYQLIPLERSSEIFEEIFSIPLSQGTISNIIKRSSDKLIDFEDFVINKLLSHDVLGHDESGLNIGGKLHWLHVCSSPLFTHYSPHRKRGQQAFDDIGILPNFSGTLVHDHWAPYFNYKFNHSLCNGHHLRELIFIFENYNQKWAKKMMDLLIEIKEHVDSQSILGQLIETDLMRKFENKFSRILREGIKEIPLPEDIKVKRRGRKKKPKALNLIERFRKYKKSVLAFMYDLSIPFDNNQSERDIRMLKVKQKISGLFRSYDGAINFCRIRSFISTVKKHDLNIHEQIYRLLIGENIIQQFS